MATTIPVGISEGCKIQRPIVSATIRSSAPVNAEAGSKNSCFDPTKRRAKCGPIKPTKPIPPQASAILK